MKNNKSKEIEDPSELKGGKSEDNKKEKDPKQYEEQSVSEIRMDPQPLDDSKK